MMDHDLLTRDTTDLVADDDSNTVVVQLAQYGKVRSVTDMSPTGVLRYRETIRSVKPAERITVRDVHHGNLIGHAEPTSFRESPDPTIDLTIADTTAGRDLLALVRSGSVDSVSMEFMPNPADRPDNDGVVHRDVTLFGVAFATRPAHTAPILATRETKETTMTNENDSNDQGGDTLTADTITADDLASLGNELRREMIAYAPNQNKGAAPVHPLAKYRNLADFAIAAYDDDELTGVLNRALVDQITTDNPGVVPPAWLSTVFGVIDQARPAVTAFGSLALPPSGMEVDFPYLDPALDMQALVLEQLAEGEEIASVLVKILRGVAPLKTYAGGSTVSYQLLRRSSPSYRDTYSRVMSTAFGITTDAAFGVAVTAAAVPGEAWPLTGTLADLKTVLFKASVQVQAATGAPAGFVLAATDAYLAIGTLDGLVPPVYGTVSIDGTAQASTLGVNVSGLPVIHDPYLATGTILVSNSSAAQWHEEGPMTVTEEDVASLGQNVAVWGMGASVVGVPAGIVALPAL